MKKASRIIISILLIAAMIVPAAIFANAEVNVSTTPSKQGGEPYEYYNLKDGLYTKKTVSGPLDNGNYQVELEAYTSDVRYLTADKKGTIDILIALDNSSSMGSSISKGSKAYKARDAIAKTLDFFVNQCGAGNKFNANISVFTFSNKVTHQIPSNNVFKGIKDENYETLNSSTLKGLKTKVYNIPGNPAAGGTETHHMFKTVYDILCARKSSNTQLILFVTDGVPSLGTAGFNGFGNDYANVTIAYTESIKKMGAKIFSIGIGNDFKSANSFAQNKNTLSSIVTSGYLESGISKKAREANLFLNIVSSGWNINDFSYISNNIKNKKAYDKFKNMFDWDSEDSDNETAAYYYNNLTEYRGLFDYGYYAYWAKDRSESSTDWQMLPRYFSQYIDAENPSTKYCYGGVESAEDIAHALSDAVIYAISTHVISEGTLLGDYTIKDTVSNYFEVAQNSTKIYKIPYDYKNGSFIGGDTVNSSHQYGESNRKWGAPTDITDKIQYTENNNSVEVLASPENSSVIDTCVLDDIVDSSNEKHGGNKLRITFEIRPKNSFMGGSDVPTNIYKESGIFDKDGKAVQNFANLSATGILDTSSVPKLQVELVNANAHIDDDNVKIGYLYNLDDLGKKNLTLTYKGRYSNDEYTVKLKDSEYVVYDAAGNEVKYSELKATDENPKSVDTKPDDYAEIIIGENHIDETLNNKGIVTNSKLIQFNSTGITQTDGKYSMQTPKVNKYVYLLWKGMKTSSTYLNERFPEYNKTGKDSKATTLDGIVNGIRYFSGREAIRQLDTQFNVNVFVPTIKVSDAISGSNSEYPYDSATVSDAFDKYSSQNKDAVNVYKNNEVLTSLVFAQIDVSAGEFVRLIPNGSTIIVNSTQHSGFISDAFSTSSASSISAYVKAFADKDGNIKTANSVISDKDQIKLTLSYNELADKTASFPTDAPFKFTVDEFWATNECSVCKDNEKYIPQFLGYQEQVHVLDRTSSITVNKTGCDANHTNESFVFSVLAFKSKSDNSGADLSSMKVLNNFTIQGNGQRTITVDNQYDYYCVVEDLNSLNDVISGWTWDYSGVSVNGINWDTIENNLFKLESKQIKMLTFNNQYDNNNNNLHYASAYASNIMSHDKVEVTTSPSNTTK